MPMALGGVTFRTKAGNAHAGNVRLGGGGRLCGRSHRAADALAARLRVQQTGGYAIWGRDTDHIEKGFVFGGMPARNR